MDQIEVTRQRWITTLNEEIETLVEQRDRELDRCEKTSARRTLILITSKMRTLSRLQKQKPNNTKMGACTHPVFDSKGKCVVCNQLKQK